jgi:4-amino-4-deoxy-L-arabinose transferase-like glycosyltransferase
VKTVARASPPLTVPEHDRSAATEHWRWPLALILGVTAWRLLVAATVPVTQDEAYYFDWARIPRLGLFRPPPGVALLGIGTWIDAGSAFFARLGAVAAGALTLLVLWRFYRACGLTRRRDLLLAMVLAAGTLPGMISGVITTPDTVLALCWALACTRHWQRCRADAALADGRHRHRPGPAWQVHHGGDRPGLSLGHAAR